MLADTTPAMDPSRCPAPTMTADSSSTSSASGYNNEGCADNSTNVSAPAFCATTTAWSKRAVLQRLSYQYWEKSTSPPTSAPKAELTNFPGPSWNADLGSSSASSPRNGLRALVWPG